MQQVVGVKQFGGCFLIILNARDINLAAAVHLNVGHHDPRDRRNVLNCYDLLIALRLVKLAMRS